MIIQSLLEMVIWMDWPLANDQPYGPASCKLQVIIEFAGKKLVKDGKLKEEFMFKYTPFQWEIREENFLKFCPKVYCIDL